MEPEDADPSQVEGKPNWYWIRFLGSLVLALALWALGGIFAWEMLKLLAVTIALTAGVIALARLFARLRNR